LEIFSSCGFTVEDFGKGCVIIREIPMLIDPSDAEDVVCEIANNLLVGKTDAQTDRIDMILHTTACKAAIKAGNNNSAAELSILAKQVLFDNEVRFCPHGRPVLIEMTKYELEKQFGRIQ
ncbi:MAG: DNA mismatch repair protein MutL, partial [Acutalibacteraceae bacterium]